jgi:Zn-dependent metalloprotease
MISSRKQLTLCITLLIITVFSSSFASTNFQELSVQPLIYSEKSVTLASGEQAVIVGKFNEYTGAPARVQGGITLFSEDHEISNYESFIDRNSELFGITSNKMEILQSKSVRGIHYFNSRQLLDNRPVLGTRIMLRVSSDGNIIEWGSDIVSSANLLWNSQISESEASLIVANAANLQERDYNFAEEIWIRLQEDVLPAYMVKTGKGIKRYRGVVLAETGELLDLHEAIFHNNISGSVDGWIYETNMHSNPVEVQSVNHVVRLDGETDTYTDNSGQYLFEGLDNSTHNIEFRLENEYWAVHNEQIDMENGPAEQYNPFKFDYDVTPPAVQNLTWVTDGELEIPESAFNVFYFLEEMRNHIFEIEPDIDFFDEQFFIFPEQTAIFLNDNAGYMPGVPELGMPHVIMFGAGTDTLANLGLFSEIVMHELTHAFTYLTIPEDFVNHEFDSIHEGVSDYFACSYLNNPEVGRGFFLNDMTRILRNLDNNLIYPDDMTEQPHLDGQIIGGAFWDLRDALGAEETDALVHFARYGHPSTFEEYYHEIMIADDDNGNLEDGTPNGDLITQIFADRGIIDGVTSVGDIDNRNLLPQTVTLAPVYPNPFNAMTRISFELQNRAAVRLTVLNILGQEVATIAENVYASGRHEFSFHAADLSSGVYMLRLESGNINQMQKIVLVK